MHPLIPSLPLRVDSREEFLEVIERLYEFYVGVEVPFRLSGFGSWGSADDERNPNLMLGGVMFSVFEAPKNEPIGTVRTTVPVPDVFDIVWDLESRLRRSGCIVSCNDDEEDVSHILEIRRPGIPDQTWQYGIEADDVQAILLFLQNDCVDIRRVRPDEGVA
jgi:hypothetical protein